MVLNAHRSLRSEPLRSPPGGGDSRVSTTALRRSTAVVVYLLNAPMLGVARAAPPSSGLQIGEPMAVGEVQG